MTHENFKSYVNIIAGNAQYPAWCHETCQGDRTPKANEEFEAAVVASTEAIRIGALVKQLENEGKSEARMADDERNIPSAIYVLWSKSRPQ